MSDVEMNIQQDPLQTQAFWTNLTLSRKEDDLLNVTEEQIHGVQGFLDAGQKRGLIQRRKDLLTAIKNESVQLHPVQVPESVLKTFSDKYEEKISDSKRKRYQKMPTTILYRKKVNAEDVERAESKHKDEKNSRLAKFLDMVQTSYPTLLHGKSVDDFMSDPGISDRAEFLVYDDAHLFENLNVLFGEKFEADLGQECVRQFMELDLSADLRTDKAFAKDAERLEKVTSKARAMINLADNHPEIKESLSPKEREEFEAKLDRAFAFVDYYMIRKDIITDEWYRNHENSEISSRFEPMPKILADQLKQEREARAQAEEQARQQGQATGEQEYQPTRAEKLEQLYYRQQNLTRKIWDAQMRADALGKYTQRTKRDLLLFEHIATGIKQEESEHIPENWYSTLDRFKDNIPSENATPVKNTIDINTELGKFFSRHNKFNDPYHKAVTDANNFIAGTNDRILDLDRSYYAFANWHTLESLPHKELIRMLHCMGAYRVKVTENTPPKVIEQLRNQELEALRIFKKLLMNETKSLEEKYGIGMRLESPASVLDHAQDIRLDSGNGQTNIATMKFFEKYGILDPNDPADVEMKIMINYMNWTHSSAGIMTEVGAKLAAKKEDRVYPSYSDVMRQYQVRYQHYMNQVLTAGQLLKLHELEKRMESTLRVKWEKELHYTAEA